jgi:acyl-homoserine-lactone acylase
VIRIFRRTVIFALPLVVAYGTANARQAAEELWKDVEIIRTEHGVPHIRATSLRAGAYGLAWVMSEDYGPRTAMTILRVSGNMSRVYGRDSIESDFSVWYDKHRAIENYHRLDELTRDVYEGFAVGLNRYIELNPEDFPPGMPRFTGYDVAAQDIGGTSGGAIRSYQRMLEQGRGVAAGTGGGDTEEQTVDNVG